MKATAVAGANIALIKYWGNRDEALRLPMNSSLSITLDTLLSTSTVMFDGDLEEDEISIDGTQAEAAVRSRVVEHLDRLRRWAGSEERARVASYNNFPRGAGLAASASGFAALTAAATRALGLSPDQRELSSWARTGSGSAARSILGGYVEWRAADRHPDSYAEQIAPPEHWELLDCIAIVSTVPKSVSSAEGHRLAPTSPLYRARLAQVEAALPQVRQAILERDFQRLGELAEAEALSLHAIMWTSRPSLMYWTPETVRVLAAVREWPREGLSAYFTLDAGPNVHVLTMPEHGEEVSRRLAQVEGVQQVRVARPGPGVHLVEQHLF